TTPSVGLVVALPEEWAAAKLVFGDGVMSDVPGDPNAYATTRLPCRTGVVNVVMAFLPRMGTNSASAVATNMLRSFPHIKDLVFCGIAAACPRPSTPDHHVRLGDLVTSDARGVVQLDHKTAKPGGVDVSGSVL